MRIFFSALTAILGVLALLGSWGLHTIWTGTEQVTATTPADLEEAPLTVITSGVEVEEGVDYTLTGDGEFTLMLGQTRDVNAWIGDAAHNIVLGVDPEEDEPVIKTSHVAGETEIPDPRGSDLWIAEQTVEGEVTQRWAAPETGEWSLLVVGQADSPAPTQLSITWTRDGVVSGWATFLLWAGIILLVIAVLLLLWIYSEIKKHKDKKPGGRRVAGRDPVPAATATSTASNPVVDDEPTGSGSGPLARRVTAGALGLSLLAAPLGVGAAWATTESAEATTAESAESASGAETASEPETATESESASDTESALESASVEATDTAGDAEGTAEDAVPVVMPDQLEMILGRISAAVAPADEAGDAELLTDRIAGQARAMRENNYRERAVNDARQPLQTFEFESVSSAWMDTNPNFPRTVLAVIENGADLAPQLVTLRQETARDQYQLVHNAVLMPGAELPVHSLTDTATGRVVDPAEPGLAGERSAIEALQATVGYLVDPNHEAAGAIADSQVITKIHESQASEQEAQEAADASVSYSRDIFADSVQAWTIDEEGTAVVIGAGTSLSTYVPDEGGEITISEEVADMDTAHEGNVYEDGVRLRYREQFALLVTPEGEISLIGYLSGLQDVEAGQG